MLPAEWMMSLTVLGLVVALLVAASFVRRYQQYKAEQRSTVRRIASAIPLIETALKDLSSVPLSRDLRTSLRADVFNRYRTIRQVHSRYPDIDQRMREAKSRLDNEGPDSGGTVPAIEDEQKYQTLIRAVDRLVEFFERGGPISGQRVEQRLLLLQQLKERRAEIMARFHVVQASRLKTQGDVTHARQHLQTLIGTLRNRGPNTDFVRELYLEAEKLLSGLTINGAVNAESEVQAEDSEPAPKAAEAG